MRNAATAERLEALVNRPWSREVLVDEDGSFVARVPELDGCFADGASPDEAIRNLDDVLRDWLAIALEEGITIPEPRSRTQDYSGRFSIRVPRSLHRKLAESAEAEACSLNQYVSTLLATAARNEEETHAPTTGAPFDANEDIAADAVRHGPQAIGALKGIATFLRDRGAVNLACLFYAASAERIAQYDGAEAASREYGSVGALARRAGHEDLAIALWYESLRHDRSNLRSASALGQLLHHQGRYREAADLLADAPDFDNHAKLFGGWSRLLASLQEDDERGVQEGLAKVVDALRSWAYRNSSDADREAWVRQVNRLQKLGPRFAAEVKQLLDFATSHASWRRVTLKDLDRIRGRDEPWMAGVLADEERT